jgi:dTDP-4-dehydrorhamnose reductase
MVTGGSGLLAHAVVPALAAAGHEVHATTHADLDVAVADAFTARARTVNPDWILHFAAWAKVDDCEADPGRARSVNTDGSRHAALAARETDAGLLAISSDYVFDGTARTPYRETDTTGPLSVYGRTKLAGEEAIHAVGVRRCLIVRTAWLFGPGGGNFVDTILARAEAGASLSIVDDQRGSPTYTPDLAQGLLQLVERAENGTYHVVNTGDASWYDLATAAVEAAGGTAPIARTTTAALGRPAPRPQYSVLDSTKFATTTGSSLPHWKDAVTRHVRLRKEAA